jgi:hypothetical protein
LEDCRTHEKEDITEEKLGEHFPEKRDIELLAKRLVVSHQPLCRLELIREFTKVDDDSWRR